MLSHRLSPYVASALLPCLSLLVVLYLGFQDIRFLEVTSNPGKGSTKSVSQAVSSFLAMPLDASAAATLFGSSSLQRSPPETPPPPPSRLDLTLAATFTHSDPKRGSALIGRKGQSSEYFHVEKEVISGVVLKEVHTGYVTITRNGRDEILQLPILTGKHSNDAAVSDHQRSSTTEKYPQEVPSSIPDLESSEEPTSIKVKNQSLTERLQALRSRRE